MNHCPGCQHYVATAEYVDGLVVGQGSYPCPGCPACAEKDKALQVADEMRSFLLYLRGDLRLYIQDEIDDMVQRYREARKAAI